MGSLAQVGLALATAVGAWINFALLLWFAARRDLLVIDDRLKASAGKLAIAGIALAVALFAGARVIPGWLSGWTTLRAEITLALLAGLGAVVYFGIVFALFGRQWLAVLKRHRKAPRPTFSDPE